MADLWSSLRGALAVPDDYRLLLEFAAGVHGWFVSDEARAKAHEAIRELVDLRTYRDSYPDAGRLQRENARFRRALENIAQGAGAPHFVEAQEALDAAKGRRA